MKLATFNANGIRARIPVIVSWLKQEGPDILCLQETKVQDQDFPRAPFEELGYVCSFRGQKSYNGVAVFTKEAPEKVDFGFGDGDRNEEPRIVTVWVAGIHVVNTYVPQGFAPESEKFEYKLLWLERLKRFFEARFKKEDDLVWLGDFNVAPEPMDVYDPERLLGHVGFHPKEHEALKTLKGWGFCDILRKHEPSEKVFTFWDYRIPKAVERGLGWRIDHIWATRSLAQRSKASWVDTAPRRWNKPSDHTFLVAEFATVEA